jgi:hypothetical protein
MNAQEKKSKALAIVDAAMAVLNKIPPLEETDINLSAGCSVNPFNFLMDLFKTTAGYDYLINLISSYIVIELPILEAAIKALLLARLKNIISCNLNIYITDDMIRNGFVFDLNEIDIVDTLKYSPLGSNIVPMQESDSVSSAKNNNSLATKMVSTVSNKISKLTGKNSNIGRYYYFGCDDCECADDIRDLMYEDGGKGSSWTELANGVQKDMNALLWYMKTRALHREVWGQSLSTDVKDSGNYPTKDNRYTKDCGILTFEYTPDMQSVKDAVGNQYVTQRPMSNILHVFIGCAYHGNDEVIRKHEEELATIQDYLKRVKELEEFYNTKLSSLRDEIDDLTKQNVVFGNSSIMGDNIRSEIKDKQEEFNKVMFIINERYSLEYLRQLPFRKNEPDKDGGDGIKENETPFDDFDSFSKFYELKNGKSFIRYLWNDEDKISISDIYKQISKVQYADDGKGNTKYYCYRIKDDENNELSPKKREEYSKDKENDKYEQETYIDENGNEANRTHKFGLQVRYDANTLGEIRLALEEFEVTKRRQISEALATNVDDQKGMNMYPEISQNHYYHKTIMEFTWDYVMSLRLFDSKVVAAQLIDAITGCLSIDLNLSYKQMLIKQEVTRMVQKVIETDDTTVSDCFFSFSNEDYDSMLQKAELTRAGLYTNSGEERATVKVDAESIMSSLNTINAKSTQEQIQSVISGALIDISRSITDVEESTQKSLNASATFNFLEKLLNNLARIIVQAVLSPKLYLIIRLNFEMLGNDCNFNLEEFIAQFKNWLVDIIRKIRDQIISWLVNELNKLLATIASDIVIKFAKEQAEYYSRLIKKILECLRSLKGKNLDFNIADVDYADIEADESEEPQNNEC